jgi:hypothetical protein
VKSYHSVLIVVLLAVLTPLASAGIFFGKKSANKVDPAQKVQQLLATVKGDGDESKRATAAEELRDFDAGQFPEMVPVLADVVLTDPKVSVRTEAAQTLGKIRPINQQAGWALEQTAAKDISLRVRLAAKTALMGYYVAGFKGGKKDQGFPTAGKEPPLADPTVKLPPPPAPTVRTPQPSSGVQPTRVIPTETAPPPLADPGPGTPQSRSSSQLEPTPMPVLQPAPKGGDEGPMLMPPG